MLLLILVWLLTTASVLSLGAGLLVACRADATPPKAAVLAVLGLMVASAVLAVWALALPLGHGYGAGLYLASLLPLGARRVRRVVRAGFDWSVGYGIAAPALALLMACALLKATGPTEVFDDAVGYLPIFRSMLDYGVIIGFGNLHPNFAYNSHWSLLGAFYSFEWLVGRPLYDINGWVAWLGAWYAFSFLPALWAGRVRGLYLLVVALPFFFFRNQMSGNSTDLPLAIVSWVVLAEWLLGTDGRQPALGRLLFVALPVFAFTLKVTALSLLVLPLALLAEQRGRTRILTLAVGVGAAILFLAPWLARNVLMTGYLYFLVPKLDLLAIDWKMPLVVIDRLKAQVAGDIHHSPKRLADPAWWRAFLLEGLNLQNRLIVLLAFGSMAAGALAAALGLGRLGRTQRRLRYLAFCAVQGIGVLFWFAAATEPRYGHAALTMASLGLLCWALARVPQPWLGYVGKAFVVGITGLMAVAALRSLAEFTPYTRQVLIYPAPYPEVEWRNEPGANFTAHWPYRLLTPLDDRLRFPATHTAGREKHPNCWCTPLPCIYRPQDLPLLEQRGPSLRDGFRYKRPPRD